MSNWKDLGEVPDSEDESFDSGESQQERHADYTEHEGAEYELPTAAEVDDVWRIPSSPPRQNSGFLSRETGTTSTTPQASISPASSPLSSPPRDEDLDNGEGTGPANSSLEEVIFGNPPRQLTRDSPRKGASSLGDGEAATRYTSVTAASPAQSTSGRPTTTTRPPPSTRSPNEAGKQLSDHERLVEDADVELSRAVVQAERSLRPRKPIQQHPYLLENAQYSKFMKSHGVRPISITIGPAISRPRGKEDSQDQEFEAHRSQERTADDSADRTDESQPHFFDDATDDRDILALSLSPEMSSPRAVHPETSSQQAHGDQTDDTSVMEEDFPSLDDLARKITKTPAKNSKRYHSSRSLSSRKKARPLTSSSLRPPPPSNLLRPDLWDMSSVSPETRAIPEQSQDLGNTPRFPSSHRPQGPSGATSDRTPSPDRNTVADVVDLTGRGPGDASSDSEAASLSSDSGRSDVVQQNRRRIRGVLPASYLRVAQQNGRDAARKNRRSPDPSPNLGPRRGLALPKLSNPKPSTASTPFFFNDSDDDNDDNELGTEPTEPTEQQELRRGSPLDTLFDDDDDGSVVEEDHIDRMLFRNKRSGASSDGLPRSKKRKMTQQPTSNGPQGQKTRQPRITQVLGQSRAASGDKPVSRPHKSSRKTRRRPTRMPKPPELSILDVVEPKAPQFIRVAARTARTKKNLGKSSPSRKHIDLGTRKDNVDARSVLHDWRVGKIRPRIPNMAHKADDGPARRHPLGELSANPGTPRSTLSESSYPNQPNVGKQGHAPEHVTADKAGIREKLPRNRRPALRTQPSARPAQLEIVEHQRPESAGFVAKKRALDALYRKGRKTRTVSAAARLDQSPDTGWPPVECQRQGDGTGAETGISPKDHQRNNKKSRFRKRFAPTHIDLEAPRFTHANDPLPVDDPVAQELEEPRSRGNLTGLGPYGTQYTQHFEVFPLDHGVFFHESTMIGRGFISKLMESGYLDKVRQTRPRASFGMDGQTLRWGPWNDTTSSELGILVDWIMEQFSDGTASEGLAALRRPVQGSEFILLYVVDSLSLADDAAAKSFIARTTEVFQGLLTRIEESASTFAASEPTCKAQIEVLTFSIVTILAVYQVNYGAGSNFSVNIQLEELLTRAARQCIKMLLDVGLEDLRVLYGDLQQLFRRESGIRREHTAANSWVVLIRTLESACIPRSSFWDITQSVMMESEIVSGSDARGFESLWRDMFTLLPLCEFDNSGILTAGMRHLAPIEGWTLAQQMLKRVFQLYTSNPRQGPNFNEYCRALAARCHYLVQQWGWQKCSGIIGTIFDFFGSQNLAHLRNEEVYNSPKFLENLSRNPSLAIEPEDRCFHIFIKTLGLVILRLKKLGLTKDIKNLIARTLPNHSRQHLKENMVRQQDLAALRNHHDLLCTLFWAAPPALRPGVHLIEKLVVPGSSHKEACLINLRAWSQLARFVVGSSEGNAAFRPFMSWQTSIFQQLLDQYLSVASDIQQQSLALSKDGPGISTEVVDSMIEQNKAAAMEILYLSIKASFDVLKLAGSLGTATSTLNIYQLQQTFTRLDLSSPGFDWSIILVAMETLELYISKVEQAAEAQYSSDSSNMTDPQELEEAILLLDHRVAEQFFFMARTLLELPSSSERPSEHARYIEKAVTLSARMACRFIHSGITRTVSYFTSRKYGLFRRLPANLDSPQRNYLPLFLATLIKNNVFDFKDIGPSLLGLWLLAIVKPLQSPAYENYLADTLKQKNIPYLQRVVVPAGIAPDYGSNRDFLAAGLSFMRKDLRDINSAQRKQRRDEHAKCLQLTMQKMKDDLRALKPDPAKHKPYMEFAREIIGLIKSHGVGICVVDPFFTQPSSDYSPPMQDPQLHTAGIIAYGVRLGEGEATAAPQLFHYLYNNFKIALANDKLSDECTILEHAMGNPHIVSFMLGRVLPAVTWATAKANEAWPLLDVYVGAFRNLLTRSCVPKEIDEDNLGDVSGLLKVILAWFRTLQGSSQPSLSITQLHIMMRLTELASLLHPSLVTHFHSEPRLDTAGLDDSVTSLGKFAEEASTHLDEILDAVNPEAALACLQTRPLFAGIEDCGQGLVFQSGREMNPQVDNFANVIVADVSKNWAVTATSISWNTPGRGAGLPPTQSGPGALYEFPSGLDLVKQLHQQLGLWRVRGEGKSRRQRRNTRLKGVEPLIF